MTARMDSRYVYFVIVSDEIDPDEISRELGLVPDWQVRKGEMTDRPSAFRRPERENCWEIYASGDSSVPVDDLIGDVLTRMAPISTRIRALRHRGCMMRFTVVLRLSPDDVTGPGYGFTREQLEVLRQCDTDADADLYVFPDRQDG